MSGLRARQQERILRAAVAALPPVFPPVLEPIDWGCIGRIAAFAEQRQVELGPAAWAALSNDWRD